LTSIRCGSDFLQATADEALAASRDCLAAYRDALLLGKPLWVERDTASGAIRDLLTGVQDRKRAEFLDRRTLRKGSRRRLKVDGVKALPASAAERRKLREFVAGFAAGQPNPGFYALQDVARRIAGTGSLGLPRFVILVYGKGSPDENYLLDLKVARRSALAPRLERIGIAQPRWSNEAQRVVIVQKWMQAVDHAFLVPVEVAKFAGFAGEAYVLKELQPSEDRVALGERGGIGGKAGRLHDVVGTMGRVLAWDQLRSAGRGGSARADELIEFAAGAEWTEAVLALAETMTQTTQRQWVIFRASGL
jgi:uncharacterized protein (DUF2252 family)